MSQPFDWKEHTRNELVQAVEHLRSGFRIAVSRVDEMTRHLSFAILHPELPNEPIHEYEVALGQMNRSAGVYVQRVFAEVRQESTELGYFAAFLRLRSQYIRRIMLLTYDQFHALGKAQAALLWTSASVWALDQAGDLLQAAVYATNFWIKSACDVQSETTDADELSDWASWCAPKLLVMKPYGQILFEAELVWRRQDEETTLRRLQRFMDDCRRELEGELQNHAGATHLQEVKQAPIPAEQVSASIYPPAVSPAENDDVAAIPSSLMRTTTEAFVSAE